MQSESNIALRERFYSEGLKKFSSCEALELILSFVLPREDNHALAASLIERFGSFHNVLEVPHYELKEEVLNDTTVAILKMMPAFSNYYLSDCSNDMTVLDSYDTIGKFALLKMGERNSYILSLILLSADNHFIAYVVIATEEVSIRNVPLRRFSSCVFRHKAEKVVIVTNHPLGTLRLNTEERFVTRAIGDTLERLGVTLVDQIIVSSGRFSSLSEIGMLRK